MKKTQGSSWIQVFSTTAIACCLAASSLFAAGAPREQEKPGPFGFAYPKDLGLKNPRDFYLYAQALAMQAQEDGLDFMMKNTAGAGTLLTDAKTEGFSGKGRDWDYNFGGRLGFGVFLDHDAWNFDLGWTWVYCTNDHSTTGNLIPEWLNTATSSSSTARSSGSSTWNCYFNTIDARLGKPFYVSKKLILNPFYGIRFAKIDQTFSIDTTDGSTSGTGHALFSGDNDFWGLGARVGMDSEWIISPNWKFFCNSSTSLLAGKFRLRQSIDFPSASSSSNSFQDNFQMNVPCMDIAAGVHWGTPIQNKTYYLSLEAGYEFQLWWNQFNLRRLDLGNNAGSDFSLNGFTLKLQLDM